MRLQKIVIHVRLVSGFPKASAWNCMRICRRLEICTRCCPDPRLHPILNQIFLSVNLPDPVFLTDELCKWGEYKCSTSISRNFSIFRLWTHFLWVHKPVFTLSTDDELARYSSFLLDRPWGGWVCHRASHESSSRCTCFLRLPSELKLRNGPRELKFLS